MRAGEYAVYDGVEYSARVLKDAVVLIVPRVGPCPDGWGPGNREHWICRVPRASVTRLFSVTTFCTFRGIRVAVNDIYPVTETAWISYVPDSEVTPPPPVFVRDPDPGIADWSADVPWGSLTDVEETIEEIPIVPPNVYN